MTEATRCAACRKKLGLLGFACPCGHQFCARHRLPEDHACAHVCKDPVKLVKVVADKITDRLT